MLFQAVILAVIAASFVKAGPTDKQQSEMMEIANACQITNPITDDDLALLHKHIIPDSIAAHCFMACFIKKQGLIGEDTMVNHDAAIARIKDILSSEPENLEKALKLTDYCTDEANTAVISTDDKACGRATVAYACLRDNKEKFGFAFFE